MTHISNQGMLDSWCYSFKKIDKSHFQWQPIRKYEKVCILTHINLNKITSSYLYFRSIVNSGLSFFFSICCLAKSAVTNANAPPVMLASPNSDVPLNAPAIVTPSVHMANPHGILLFTLFISF